MISKTVVATRRAHAVAMASNFRRKPIVAVRRAHGGCNCAADSWFRVVAVICCNPDFLLKKRRNLKKKGPHATQNTAGLEGHGLRGGVETLGSTPEGGGREHPGEVYQCQRCRAGRYCKP